MNVQIIPHHNTNVGWIEGELLRDHQLVEFCKDGLLVLFEFLWAMGRTEPNFTSVDDFDNWVIDRPEFFP